MDNIDHYSYLIQAHGMRMPFDRFSGFATWHHGGIKGLAQDLAVHLDAASYDVVEQQKLGSVFVFAQIPHTHSKVTRRSVNFLMSQLPNLGVFRAETRGLYELSETALARNVDHELIINAGS